METLVPPGWPATVRPPGVEGWERQAIAHLLDCCPPDFRREALFARHPLVLAIFAERCVQGQQRAAHDGLALVRADLGDRFDQPVVDAAVDVWQAESARLIRVVREVDLLRRAFSGEQFVPTLAGRWNTRPT
ncbi:hypothetical protein [Microlunatus soli]|uniref:Uncharacterized protein n=1 Tax=Microlunatus soli TaxID=630515 RepID=A0A1H2AQK3_9ACTN|nr:hypothetical protein [Microlunatus soli]SDT48193.1 hypothetical protein SAMN04489812_6146 [Microlunatus soli]